MGSHRTKKKELPTDLELLHGKDQLLGENQSVIVKSVLRSIEGLEGAADDLEGFQKIRKNALQNVKKVWTDADNSPTELLKLVVNSSLST